MDKDIRESIALTRFQIISPILAEPKRAQNDYFREQAGKEHVFARYGARRISVSAPKNRSSSLVLRRRLKKFPAWPFRKAPRQSP